MLDDAARAARRETVRRLETQITEIVGHLNAGTHRFLALIAEFDRLGGWSDGATYSCAHWLNWKCGIGLGAAREHLRVAQALETLPFVSRAMACGELSYSKVRAITRVATPANEEYFLYIARHGTAHHVETLVRGYRRAKESEELSRAQRQFATRSLMWLHDDDGSLVIKVRVPAETGELFIRAIEAAEPEVDVPAGTSAQRVQYSARRADALAVLAESFLAHGAEELSGGDRNQIFVHVSAATLRESTAGRCGLADGPGLAAESARRLACDASIVTVTEGQEGEPLNVGRKTRSIPPAIRRALESRDGGCRFPGCTHKRYVDGHHIRHWAHGGETRLSNLITLCRFHHRLVHEGCVAVQALDDGGIRFTNQRGERCESAAPVLRSDWPDLLAVNHESDIRIDVRTAVTRWLGERMDYGMAVDALLSLDRRALLRRAAPA